MEFLGFLQRVYLFDSLCLCANSKWLTAAAYAVLKKRLDLQGDSLGKHVYDQSAKSAQGTFGYMHKAQGNRELLKGFEQGNCMTQCVCY